MVKGSRWRCRLLVVLLAVVTAASGPAACRRSHSPTEGDIAPPTPAPATRPPFPPPPPPCPLPAGGGSGERCPYELPAFALPVNEAIAIVQNEHPELFDFTKHRGGLSYLVVDPDRYTAGVAYVLSTRGFCAIWDGEEIAMKNTNAFNEQYDILTFEGYVRWGAGAYQSTCYPAWF
jgi:hypothetical protein